MKLEIFAVGDIMLGEQHLCNNFGVRKIMQKNGPDFLFENVSPLFAGGDIVFGNLECSIKNNDPESGKSPRFFCAGPDAVNGLKNAHFNVLSVANNHIMENGQDSFLHTVQILKDHTITPVGIRGKRDILPIKGYRVAFLAYSFIEDSIEQGCYNKIQSEGTILEEIQNVQPDSDLIIVSLHWGREYVPCPSPEQIRIGRTLIDAGADIIIGGHPHVTQSFEIYKKRPIFYSLGNFIFDDTYNPTTCESFIAQITVNDSRDSIEAGIIPILIDTNTYQPRLSVPPRTEISLKSVDTIRHLFENKSLPEYSDSVGDYNLLYTRYKNPVKWNTKMQFLKNMHRYSLSTTFGILKEFLGSQRGDK
jgi:poly-gamma-glutamate synthesis protein (capsule biosynthesis protein)